MNLPLNALFVAFASAVSALAQWLIVIFLGRIEGPVALGSYSLAQSWVLVLSYFSMLAFRQQVLAGNLGVYSFSSLFWTRFLFSLLLFLPVVVIVYFFSDYLYFYLFLCAVVYKFSDLLIDLLSVWYQAAKKFFFLATVSVLRLLFVMSFFVVSYYCGLGLVVSFLLMLVSAFIFAFVFDFRFLNLRFFDFLNGFSLSVFWGLVKTNFWFAASNVLMVLSFALLRQLVGFFSDGFVLGYFSASFQIVTLISFFVTATGQILLPKFGCYFRASNWAAFSSLLRRIVFLLIVFGLLLVLIALMFGSEVFVFIYGAAFLDGYPILIFVFVSAVPMFVASVVGASAYAAGSKSIMLKGYFYSLFSLLILGGFLGYFFGVFGVLFAFSAVMIFQSFYFYFVIKKLMHGI